MSKLYKKFRWIAVFLIIALLSTSYNLPVIVAEINDEFPATNNVEINTIKSSQWIDEEKQWISNQLNKELTKNKSLKSNSVENQSYDSIVNAETLERDLSERVNRIKQREISEAWDKQNEELTNLTIQGVSSELNVDVSIIQEQLDKGLTLNEVSSSLTSDHKAKSMPGIKSVVEKTKKSEKIESEIKSEVGNVNFSRANVFFNRGLPPPPEEPKLEMLKIKLNEAPYKVDLESESVSTISGSLSLTESDLTLPGLNGNGFTLTRTYDSGSSQLYDADVKTIQNDYYEHTVKVSLDAEVFEKKYFLAYQLHVIKTKNVCSTGALVTTYDDYWTPMQNETYNTAAERDYAYSRLNVTNPEPDRTDCAKYDRYTQVKYYLSATSTSGFVFARWETDADQVFFGPYGSVVEAENEAIVINKLKGKYYNSDSGGSVQRNYYYASATAHKENIGSYEYYVNQLTDSKDQKRAPLGIGWTWSIPYLTFDNGTFVHLANGGSYKTENGSLKGYPWKDLSLENNTTVTVNSVQSAFVLKSITGNKQYFDASGKIIQITDAYGNSTQFKYANIAPYGILLTEIIDAIGNKISISYTQSQVKLTMGDRVVTYKKTIQNEKELLTQVIDPLNRTITYDYTIKSAQFDLLSTTPVTTNPYALITSVTYPTGAKTVYEFETTPVRRQTSASSVSEVYRLGARMDIVTNAASPNSNRTSFIYLSDMGSSYNQDMNFMTKMISGQLETIYTYKKDFIDDQNPPMIYNTVVEETDLITKRITENTFDEVKRIPNPIVYTKYYKTAVAESERIQNSTTYDDYGNVLTTIDPMNKVVTYTYDPVTHLRLTEKWPASNGTFLFVDMIRNAQGDVSEYKLHQNSAAGELLRKTTYGFDSFGNIISTKDYDTGREAISNFEFSPTYGSSYLTKQTLFYKDVDGAQKSSFTTSSYDMLGNMLTFTDGKKYKTTYTHDKLDRITSIQNPDNSSFTISYDDINNHITTTNETGLKTRIIWDSIGRELETGIFEDGIYKKKTKKEYDSLNRLLWAEDPSGNRVAYTYDHSNRLIKTTNADQSFSSIVYDDVANTVTETDEEGNSVIKIYDKLGRVTTEKEVEKGQFVVKQRTVYDDADNIIKTFDGLDQATSFGYDALGQLRSVTTPLNEVFSYSYDKLGNMTQITYPGNKQITKTYDEKGNIIRYVDESSKEKIMYYDENSNISKLVDRKNAIFTYSYDSKNRLLSRVGPNDTVTYTYDADGKRKTMSDLTGVTNYQYYPDTGLLKKKIFPDEKTISYTYDLRGNKTEVVDPFDRSTIYTYDAVNRMQTVTTDNKLSGSYEYFKNDRIKKVQHGNGQSTHYSYQDFELKTLQTNKVNETSLSAYTFDYDRNGNMITRTEKTDTKTDTNKFTYDALGRVKTNTQFNEVYNYDPRGNRISLKSDAIPAFETANYSHDSWNRLVSYTDENDSVSYRYNGDDQLYERIENGIKKRYYWDEGNIVGEAIVNGTTVTPVASFVYGNGLLERIDAKTLSRATYLLNSHQDVVEMRDSSGNPLNKYTYDIWGKLLTESETISNPFRYSSEYWDPASKLIYLTTRWYDPNTARFLEEDTFEGDLKNPLSMNLYSYAHNDPIAYSDPTGNFAFLIPIAIYVAKVAIKTAADVSIDYAVSRATGTKFNIGKTVLKNGFSNAVPGLGEAKTLGKVLKAGKVIQASKAAKGTVKAVNGNSKASKKSQHGYEISEKSTGDVVKTGISGQRLNKNGTSPRANNQVNKWNKISGYDKYEAKVVKPNISNRQKALNWESQNAQNLWDKGNSMSKHQRPRPWE